MTESLVGLSGVANGTLFMLFLIVLTYNLPDILLGYAEVIRAKTERMKAKKKMSTPPNRKHLFK